MGIVRRLTTMKNQCIKKVEGVLRKLARKYTGRWKPRRMAIFVGSSVIIDATPSAEGR
jgi:hypothetical protein